MATFPDAAGDSATDIPFVEQTPEEAWADFDADVRRRLGITAIEFARRYHSGEFGDPDSDPDLSWLSFAYVGLRRNGLPR